MRIAQTSSVFVAAASILIQLIYGDTSKWTLNNKLGHVCDSIVRSSTYICTFFATHTYAQSASARLKTKPTSNEIAEKERKINFYFVRLRFCCLVRGVDIVNVWGDCIFSKYTHAKRQWNKTHKTSSQMLKFKFFLSSFIFLHLSTFVWISRRNRKKIKIKIENSSQCAFKRRIINKTKFKKSCGSRQ